MLFNARSDEFKGGNKQTKNPLFLCLLHEVFSIIFIEKRLCLCWFQTQPPVALSLFLSLWGTGK